METKEKQTLDEQLAKVTEKANKVRTTLKEKVPNIDIHIQAGNLYIYNKELRIISSPQIVGIIPILESAYYKWFIGTHAGLPSIIAYPIEV